MSFNAHGKCIYLIQHKKSLRSVAENCINSTCEVRLKSTSVSEVKVFL